MAIDPTDLNIPDDLKELWVALTPRDQRFILNFLSTGKVTESFIDAGFPAKSAGVNASIKLHRPRIWRVLYGILKAHHLTPEYADIKLKSQLEATETKFFAHEGVVIDEREVQNWAARDAALDKLLKLQGRYKPDQASTVTVINVVHAYRPHGTDDRTRPVREASHNGSDQSSTPDPISHS